MVRPKVQEPKRQFTIMLRPSTVQEIDKLAKRLELSRSQLISNLIEMGLEDAKALDKTGALWIVKAGRKALEFFREQMKAKEEGKPMKG